MLRTCTITEDERGRVLERGHEYDLVPTIATPLIARGDAMQLAITRAPERRPLGPLEIK